MFSFERLPICFILSHKEGENISPLVPMCFSARGYCLLLFSGQFAANLSVFVFSKNVKHKSYLLMLLSISYK